MREKQLLEKLLRRENDSLPLLRQHYGPLIRYIIAPILPDVRDREECEADIVLRVWERIHLYDPDRSGFRTWLTTLARNAAIDRARKADPHDPLPDHAEAPNSDPEQLLLHKERLKQLKAALAGLTYAERSIFYRKYYYRQSTAQIAAETGTTERAVEGRLYRIKQKLRKELGGEEHD